MTTVALCQARFASTRLPGKVLLEAGGRTILEHVVTRLSKATMLDRIVVATGQGEANEPIRALCRAKGWCSFSGSEDDVLSRFYRAAELYGADIIVRVTGDCPLLGPEVVDECVRQVLADAAYCSNLAIPTWPDGCDVEAVRFEALEVAWKCATLPSDREHVTPWLRRERPEWCFNLAHHPDLSGYRLTVDTQADLDALRVIMAVDGPDCTWQQAVETIDIVSVLTEAHRRNEAYHRQLTAEAVAMGTEH